MTKMYYCKQMNGPYQPVGPPTQTAHVASPLTYQTMRNQQPGTANISYQFWTVNPTVQPPENGHVTFGDGTQPNRQMSNCQTSAVSHQAVSDQSPAEWNNKDHVLFKKYPNLTSLLGEGTTLPFQNSAQNSNMQTPPKMKTPYSQQNTSAYLIQPATFHGKQSMTQVTQNHGVQGSYQIVNSKLDNLHPTYNISTASLVPCKQTAYNQNYGQTVSQQRFTTQVLPKYSEAISMSLTHNSITTNAPPRGQIWFDSSMSQRTQQYSAQLNSAANNAREATCSSKISNELLLKATADAQQLPNHNGEAMKIAGIADSLRKSYTADSNGHHPVNTISRQVIRQPSQLGEVRMECNRTLQPVTSAVERSNTNTPQHRQLISGRCWTQSAVSKTQHIVTPPQQSSAPYIYSVTTEDGNKERNTFFPRNNSFYEGNIVESSSDVSHHMQLPEGISPKKTETQLSIKNNDEMPCSVGKNDNSIHSSPNRTGTRAVAVVQPLSQENYQVVKKHNSSDTIRLLGECTAKYTSEIFTSPAVAQNIQAIDLSKGLSKHLHDGPQDKTHTPLYAHEQGSELSRYQSVTLAAQPSVTSERLEGQNRDMNKAGVPVDQNTCDIDLSSIPTTQWTTGKLIHFTMNSEKAHIEAQDVKRMDFVEDVMRVYWSDKIDILKNKISKGWYKNLITDVNKFCMEHVAKNSVILSQVEESYLEHLKSYHVLKHDEIYSELPYQSSWLNVNEQVDDIDKEFGFSWSIRNLISTPEIDSQPDEFGETSGMSAQSDVSNEAVPQTELRSVDLDEEKQASTVEITSSQMSSPDETDNAHSSDQHYAFEIQVLSPEEAKVIFGLIQNKLPQSMDTQGQPDSGASVLKSSVGDELPDVGDTLKDSKLESKKKTSLIDEFCCLAGWIENFWGTDTSLKCACKEKQGHKDSTEKTLDKETTAQNNQTSSIRLDKRDHQMNAEENIDSQVIPCSRTDICNDISQTRDLTEDEKRPCSFSAKETKNTSMAIIDKSQLSTIARTDSKVEDVSCSGSEIPNRIRENGIWISDSEQKCVQEQLKSVGSGQPSNSDNSKAVSHVSETEEGCPQAQLTSTDVAETSLEMKGPTQSGPAAGLQTTSSLCEKLETVERKRKTLQSDEDIFSLLKKFKKPVNLDSEPVFKGVKCKKVSVNAAERKPLHSNNKTVELVLFGSTRQGELNLIGDRKSNRECTVSHAGHRPPNVLSVDLNPSKKKSSVPTTEYSVKGWIHEKWRRSYLPTTIRHRKKMKTLQCTLPWSSPMKAETACPSKTKELPVSSEFKRKGNTNFCLKQKNRRLLSNRFKLGEENTRKDVGKLSDQERSDNRSHTTTPTNYVLKFSVLPNTFNFADGPNGRKEATGDMSGNSDVTGGNSPAKTITGGKRNMVTQS
ncbi:uncharacterized protein [Paralichthys olivaceus]|uniref:uncharacterized protein n=1 Tax=Paralichthys olivaceus TaxID=8255 RepID=UPI00375198B9